MINYYCIVNNHNFYFFLGPTQYHIFNLNFKIKINTIFKIYKIFFLFSYFVLKYKCYELLKMYCIKSLNILPIIVVLEYLLIAYGTPITD